MGNWWIDEEPWPGPKERPPLTIGELKEHFVTIGVNFGRAFGKMAEAYGAFSHELVESNPGYWTPKPSKPAPPTTRDEVLERKKNLQHGPYGGGFDRRGRKY